MPGSQVEILLERVQSPLKPATRKGDHVWRHAADEEIPMVLPLLRGWPQTPEQRRDARCDFFHSRDCIGSRAAALHPEQSRISSWSPSQLNDSHPRRQPCTVQSRSCYGGTVLYRTYMTCLKLFDALYSRIPVSDADCFVPKGEEDLPRTFVQTWHLIDKSRESVRETLSSLLKGTK